MANRQWLTAANTYNYKNIETPSFQVMLDALSNGIGNTAVTIPAMARGLDESMLLSPNVNGLRNLQRKQGNVTNEEAAQCWNPKSGTMSDWGWHKSRHPEAVRGTDPAAGNRTAIIAIRRDDATRNMSNDPRSPASARRRDSHWSTWSWGDRRWSRQEMMDEFTQLYLDQAQANIGLDIDVSVDVDKMINAYADPATWSNSVASDFLKITPVFNFNALTEDAKAVLLPRRIPDSQAMYSAYSGYMAKARYLVSPAERRENVNVLTPFTEAEDFDVNLSNILRSFAGTARSILRLTPVLPNNRGDQDIVYSAEGWMNKIRDPRNLVWHNPHNYFCYGDLDYAVYTANSRKHATRLRLKDQVNHSLGLFRSPNPEVRTHDIVDMHGVNHGSASDFGSPSYDFAPDDNTVLLKIGNNRFQVPTYSKRFLEATFATNTGFSNFVLDTNAKKEEFLRGFLEDSSGRRLQQIAPLPYSQSRFLSQPNKSVNERTGCLIVDGERNGSGLSFHFRLFKDNNYQDLDINSTSSGTRQVLYVRSSAIVSIDALANGLRGVEAFESPHEYTKTTYFFDANGYLKNSEIPSLVRANTPNVFVEVILERIFPLELAKIHNTIGQIQNRMNTMNADRERAIRNQQEAAAAAERERAIRRQREAAKAKSKQQGSIFNRNK